MEPVVVCAAALAVTSVSRTISQVRQSWILLKSFNFTGKVHRGGRYAGDTLAAIGQGQYFASRGMGT
jgi:hypothetical protein